MSAIEQFQSRLGEIGVNGAQIVSRWRVINTSAGRDPLADSQLPQINDPFPFNNTLIVQSRRIVERQTTTAWIVEIIYGDFTYIPFTGDPWQLSVTGGLGSIHVDAEPLTQRLATAGRKSRIIGPYHYVKQAGGSYSATVIEPNNAIPPVDVAVTRELDVLGADPPRKRFGANMTIPLDTMSLRRRFYSIEISTWATALYWRNTINSHVFYGAVPFTLKFSGLTMNQVLDPAGIVPAGYATDIELYFEHNRDGWDHKLTHTYEVGGIESTVTFSGSTSATVYATDPFTEVFWLYDAVNFQNILDPFG